MAATSIHKQICDAVASAIINIPLRDYPARLPLDEKRILVRWKIDQEPQGMPAVFVCPVGQTAIVGGTNERDDIDYPVTIFVVDRIDQKGNAGELMDAALYWREQIRKEFIHQRLASGSTQLAYICRVNPAPVVDPGFTDYKLLVEPLVLSFISRESRG